MHIKKYVANSVQEALRQVKKELGPEALILSVNNIKAKTGPLALTSPSRVEVMAAIDETAPERRYTPGTLSSPGPARSNASLPSPSDRPYQPLPRTDRPRSRRHFPDVQTVTQGAKQMAQSMKETLTFFREKNVKPGHSDQQDRLNHYGHAGHQGRERIASLCQLLKDIGLQEDIIEPIFDVLTREIPLPEDYHRLSPEELARDILQQLIKTSGPIEPDGQKPKYVALVGPTGSGKTTTIAKLSAEILLKRKQKVGLITIDTYRVGALEQLNTYAGIMNIPVKLASTFEQMRRAILQYQNQDIVLIDTAGFSHHDREHLQLLNAFLAQVSNPEIHLVLSANTSEKELIRISQAFSQLHYGRLLFTKLDESSYPGTIFNHMVYTDKPISHVTTGQKVPDDIEVATPAVILDLMFQKKRWYTSPSLGTGL